MRSDRQAASVSLCRPSLPGTQDNLYKGGTSCSLTSSSFKMLISFQELLLVLLKFERKTNAAQSHGEWFFYLKLMLELQ